MGFEGYNSGIRVIGVSVRQSKTEQEEKVYQLAQATASHIGIKNTIGRECVLVNSDYVGAGYALPTAEMVEAVRLVAEHEGILLDPVYTGKAMSALIGLIRQGYFRQSDNVVFLHTGGSVLLFAYLNSFVLRS